MKNQFLRNSLVKVTLCVSMLGGAPAFSQAVRPVQGDFLDSLVRSSVKSYSQQTHAFKFFDAIGDAVSKKIAKSANPDSANTGARSGAVGFANCPNFFPSGQAPVLGSSTPGALRELCFDSFAILHSGQSRTPLISIERVSRATILDARGEDRTDKFFADARLPSRERATLEDYARSGYDRGHMSPAANMPNPTAMAQSFSLANMVPQAPENNRKTWSKIESDTRKYVTRAAGDVFIFTGPVFDADHKSIGPNQVWVPTYLYKLVYDSSTGRSWAHWVENTDEARPGRPITYEELVQRTGIQFLPQS